MQLTDQELVRAYLNGDRAAFDQLVLRYLKPVYSVALHYAKNQEDAEDLAQDAFVKVLRHLKKFDAQKNFKPWILQIARNTALDWLKKKKPMLLGDLETEDGESLLASIPDRAPLPDAIAQENETAGEIKRAMERLSPSDRLVLQFRYIHGLSFREIAGELHEAIDTVKSRARRALQKLRKEKTFAPK